MGVRLLSNGVEFFYDMWWCCVIGIIYIEIDNIFVVLMCSYFQFSSNVKNVWREMIDMCKMVFRIGFSYRFF